MRLFGGPLDCHKHIIGSRRLTLNRDAELHIDPPLGYFFSNAAFDVAHMKFSGGNLKSFFVAGVAGRRREHCRGVIEFQRRPID